MISKSCVKLNFVRLWRYCIIRFMDLNCKYGLYMECFSVQTTFLDNTFCQLCFSFLKIYRMSSVTRETISEQIRNKTKIRAKIKYEMSIKMLPWLSNWNVTRHDKTRISAAPFLVFIFPFAFVQLTCWQGVVEVSAKSLSSRHVHTKPDIFCANANTMSNTPLVTNL